MSPFRRGPQARNTGKDFGDWLRIVTTNVIRDYVRGHLGDPLQAALENDLPRGAFIREIATSPLVERLPGHSPMLTAVQTARQLLELAASRLSDVQLRVLRCWLEGANMDEIAVGLGLSGPEEAERLKRSAVAILRREFASPV